MSTTRPIPGRAKIQDLTASLVRDWFDSACIDATVDEEDDDVFIAIDGFRMLVRLDIQQGVIMVLCSISCDEDLADHAAWLEAVNRINRRTMYVRAVLEGPDDEPSVHYEHEHFALDGIVTRRQLVKLVRIVKDHARRRHAQLHELVA